MSAKQIDGKSLAAAIVARAKRDCVDLGYAPTLAVVIIGDDPASHQYVRLKEKACREAGIRFERLSFDASAKITLVVRAIETLNSRQDVDAILVQLPLPKPLDERVIIRTIDPVKDVDGFHPDNADALAHGSPRLIPGLAAGILALIKSTDEPLRGKKAAVIANSKIFFEPLAIVLGSAGIEPFYLHPDEAPSRASEADIVVIAIGRAHFLKAEMVKQGAILIDVGTNRLDGKTVGDVDPSAADVASFVSPVPGGVGPMTVAMLIKNTVELAKKRRGHG
jgi:methylenetetrahydrofolate dehydrogenase (NADP+)/methenyltetrahydrofolate cyclohydrolase